MPPAIRTADRTTRTRHAWPQSSDCALYCPDDSMHTDQILILLILACTVGLFLW